MPESKTPTRRAKSTVCNRVLLAKRVGEHLGLPHAQAQENVDAVLAVIRQSLLDGEAVITREIGCLMPAWRAQRVAHNPRNPTEQVLIPGHTTIAFRISRGLLRDVVAMPKREGYLHGKRG